MHTVISLWSHLGNELLKCLPQSSPPFSWPAPLTSLPAPIFGYTHFVTLRAML